MAKEENFHGFQSASSQVGTISQWVDEKGFGWVEAGGKRIFVHIKDFDRGQRRPRDGEAVRFIAGIDSKGRGCAKRVTFINPGRVRVGYGVWIQLPVMLLLPLLALLWLPFPWWQGAGAMVMVSAITYGLYAHDKAQAVSAGWRIPESSLHLAELLGGWPGAYLAQKRLRHKCSKISYQVVFWGIVVLYQAAALDVMLRHRLSRALLALMAE